MVISYNQIKFEFKISKLRFYFCANLLINFWIKVSSFFQSPLQKLFKNWKIVPLYILQVSCTSKSCRKYLLCESNADWLTDRGIWSDFLKDCFDIILGIYDTIFGGFTTFLDISAVVFAMSMIFTTFFDIVFRNFMLFSEYFDIILGKFYYRFCRFCSHFMGFETLVLF